MLPPIDPAILSSNPKFNALYSDIRNNKLNPDGTSKLDAKAQRDRDGLGEDLRKARVELAKRDLVVSGLKDLSYRPDELPEDLRQLVAVVAALLEGEIAEEDKYLLHDDLAKFKNNTKQINTALSKTFTQDTTTLSTLLDPDDPPPTKNLVPSIQDLKTSITTKESHLNDLRLSLAQEASKLHALYREIIEKSISILERTIHGSLARGTKAKADYLALVAEGMSKKVEVQNLQLVGQVYSAAFQEVIEGKMGEVQREKRAVGRKVRDAEERLEEYGRVGGMRGVAREYGDVVKEIERVKADIAKLEKAK